MSDGKMAARALQSLSFAVNDVAIDRGGDVFVTTTAGVFGDLVIEFGDLDGVGIPAGCEVERMPETVVRLDGVFAEDIVRSMAIVAGSGRAVARLQPGVVLGLRLRQTLECGPCRKGNYTPAAESDVT